MATVTIACNIPGGLLLGFADAPNGQPTVPVVLKGAPADTTNPATPGFGLTEVDETFWTNWAGSTAAAAILASGAVWEA